MQFKNQSTKQEIYRNTKQYGTIMTFFYFLGALNHSEANKTYQSADCPCQ